MNLKFFRFASLGFRLIINENIDVGTQIPYIKRALSKDYGVMVLNTNDSSTDDGKVIPHSSTAEKHAKYVWENYIAQTSASCIVIVAHSYGGVVTVSLAEEVKKDFEKRVKAIALTDSVHSYSNKNVTKFLKKVSDFVCGIIAEAASPDNKISDSVVAYFTGYHS